MPTALEKLSIIDPQMAEELNKILKMAQNLAQESIYFSSRYSDAIREIFRHGREFNNEVDNVLIASSDLATRPPPEVVHFQLKNIARRLAESTGRLSGSDNLVVAQAQMAEDLKEALFNLFKEDTV
jgi:CRP-like cAMP-binding protein